MKIKGKIQMKGGNFQQPSTSDNKLSARHLTGPADVAAELICLKQAGIMEHYSLLVQVNVRLL